MNRQPLIADPAQGLLRTEHFQMAWATNDMDRAQALFGDRYSIFNWTTLAGPLAAGGEIRVELAWVGTIMYELMWAQGPGSEIYMGRVPEGAFALQHHHLGFMVGSEAEWHALIARAGDALVHCSDNPAFMTSCFVDAPELGHYLEYIWPSETGRAFFENVARN